jgi:signal transduction histidine kinase
MANPNKPTAPLPQESPARLIGMLRHEIGDLLQTVYCTVAVLQRRLPEDWQAERTFLTDLRRRAENCREVIDAVRDFAYPLSISRDSVDFAVVVEETVRQCLEHYPHLAVRALPSPPTFVRGDFSRLSQMAWCLLCHACESARGGVETGLRTISENNQVEWIVRDDGNKVLPERLERIFSPGYETRQGRPGIAMALARKIVQMHGGEGGFEICVRLPLDISSSVLAEV